LEERRSRFVATAFYLDSIESVKAEIKQMRQKHKDASHVVHAFAYGKLHSLITGMSDDGEPKGTAGRPVLDSILGRSITNVLVMVVRYFGGTLLGTGGLVQAYGKSAQQALDELQLRELYDCQTVTIDCSYDSHRALMRLLREFEIEELSESFGERVCLSFRIRDIVALDLEQKIHESLGHLIHGKQICVLFQKPV